MRSRPVFVIIVAVIAALLGGAGLSTTGAGADSTTSSTATSSTATTTSSGDAGVTKAAAAVAAAVRVSPPTTTTTTVHANPAGSASCPSAGHGAVIDRAHQRAWLCTDGMAAAAFPVTTAISQPKPGTYHVYAKDTLSTSTFGGHFSYLDNFVAFTYGTNTGARIAFHAVPRDKAGNPYQPYDTVGTAAWFGQSSGCIRVLPEQSQVIWNHLGVGDTVVVIS